MTVYRRVLCLGCHSNVPSLAAMATRACTMAANNKDLHRDMCLKLNPSFAFEVKHLDKTELWREISHAIQPLPPFAGMTLTDCVQL